MRLSLAFILTFLVLQTGGCALFAPVIPLMAINAIMAAEIDAAIGERSVPRRDYPVDKFPGSHYKHGIPIGASLDLWVTPYNSIAARKKPSSPTFRYRIHRQ